MSLLLTAIVASVLAQPIYRWTDPAGVEHFTDDPAAVPANKSATLFQEDPQAPVVRHSSGAGQPDAAPAGGPRVRATLTEAGSGRSRRAAARRLSAEARRLSGAGDWRQLAVLLEGADPSEELGEALRAALRSVDEAVRAGQEQEAVEVLERAIRRQPRGAQLRGELYRRLGAAHLSNGALGEADQALRTALQQDETDPETLLLVGSLRLRQNDAQGARDAWERGLRAQPSHRRLKALLETNRAELQHLSSMMRQETEHFVVSVEGSEDPALLRLTVQLLEEGYRQVTALYGHAPNQKVAVVVYGDRSFSEVPHPSWSAGFFDGKIRVPGSGATSYPGKYRGLLYHEFGHALFRGAQGAPAWLNEGMAQLAGNLADPEVPLSCGFGHGARLSQLTGGFRRLDRQAARLAYPTALHALEQLERAHGPQRLRELMALLHRGIRFEAAFAQAFSSPAADFIARFDEKNCGH